MTSQEQAAFERGWRMAVENMKQQQIKHKKNVFAAEQACLRSLFVARAKELGAENATKKQHKQLNAICDALINSIKPTYPAKRSYDGKSWE